MTTSWRRRLAVVAVAVTASLGLGTTSAAAAPPANASAVAAIEWNTAYQTATASGTSWWTYAGLLKTVHVTGSLSNAGTDCYRLQLLINQDLAVFPVDIIDQCGTGSANFSTGRTGLMTPTLSYAVRICRVVSGAVTGCGSPVMV